MRRIVRLVRRVFGRKPDYGRLRVIPAPPSVSPSIEDQIAAGNAYMRRYYAWLQEPVDTDGWATGGLIGGSDALPPFASRSGEVTD